MTTAPTSQHKTTGGMNSHLGAETGRAMDKSRATPWVKPRSTSLIPVGSCRTTSREKMTNTTKDAPADHTTDRPVKVATSGGMATEITDARRRMGRMTPGGKARSHGVEAIRVMAAANGRTAAARRRRAVTRTPRGSTRW